MSPALDDLADALAANGVDLLPGRLRLAVTRTGVAVGFPSDPFVHVSWGALAVVAALSVLVRRAR